MVVTEHDTAPAFQSGDVPVLATGRVVGLAESATVLAVGDRLEDGTTTVGYRVQLDHLAPTAVGSHVKAEAMLEAAPTPRLDLPARRRCRRDRRPRGGERDDLDPEGQATDRRRQRLPARHLA